MNAAYFVSKMENMKLGHGCVFWQLFRGVSEPRGARDETCPKVGRSQAKGKIQSRSKSAPRDGISSVTS